MIKIREPWLTPVSRFRGVAARLECGGGEGLSHSSTSLRNGLSYIALPGLLRCFQQPLFCFDPFFAVLSLYNSQRGAVHF